MFGHPLGGDEGHQIVRLRLDRAVSDQQAVEALPLGILKLHEGRETPATFDVAAHLLIRVGGEGALQIFFQHRLQLGPGQRRA